MLYSIETGDKIEGIPHAHTYDLWRTRLSDVEYQAIYDTLAARIDDSQIETSSWIPGSDWTGTVFQPIYEKACRYDERAAAKFFGLILWQVVRDHPDAWAFGRYKLGDTPIDGLTYFRIDTPAD